MNTSGRRCLSTIRVESELVGVIIWKILVASPSFIKRYWAPKSLCLENDSISENTGFTAAWFNDSFSLKYTSPVFIVETVTPPRIGKKSKAVHNDSRRVARILWGSRLGSSPLGGRRCKQIKKDAANKMRRSIKTACSFAPPLARASRGDEKK